LSAFFGMPTRENVMKSTGNRLSVGFVGFLGHETGRGRETAHNDEDFVGIRSEADKNADKNADKTAAAAVSRTSDVAPESRSLIRDTEKPDPKPVEDQSQIPTAKPEGFQCPVCLNDPARCGWCADHAGDPGVISCGDCEHGRMKQAGASWRRGVIPDVHDSHIPESIRAKISAIELEARALGWDPERLWNSNFWDSPRGLPAVMDEGDEIAEVTTDYIAILKTQRNILRFQRRTS
jgi:hypothetical protein